MRSCDSAKRVREEAARAKELAEKEAFVQRQMELLERAGRAPRCEYKYTDGRGCKSPQVKGERWCHGHAKMMSYRPEKLEILPMEDEQAVMVNLYRVTQSLLAGRITEKTAGLILWSAAMVAAGLNRRRNHRDGKGNTHHGDTEARRKTKKVLPRIGADARGSERRVSRESRHAATGSTRKNTNQEGARRGVVHAGVTNDKSFVSGVGAGSTPAYRRERRHRTTSCPSRPKPGRPGTPTSPRSERQNPKSLKHRGSGVSRGSHKQELHSSVSPCLRVDPAPRSPFPPPCPPSPPPPPSSVISEARSGYHSVSRDA